MCANRKSANSNAVIYSFDKLFPLKSQCILSISHCWANARQISIRLNVHVGNYNYYKCIDLQCRHSKFAPLRLIRGTIRCSIAHQSCCGTINIIKASLITISLQIAKIIGGNIHQRLDLLSAAAYLSWFALMCERVCADSPSAADQQRISQTYTYMHYTAGRAHGRHVCTSLRSLQCPWFIDHWFDAELWCINAHMHDFHANQLIPSEPPMQKKHNYYCTSSARARERSDVVKALLQERSPALWYCLWTKHLCK